MKKNTLLLFLVLLLVQANSYAQVYPDNMKIMPKSPEAEKYEQVGNLIANPSSGVPNVAVPVFNIKLKKFSWDISLSYRAKGFRVDEVASNVGLGWNLGITGLISVNTYGRSDVMKPLDTATTKRFLDLGGFSTGWHIGYNNHPDVNIANSSIIQADNHMPDIFSLNIGGLNHKFFLKDEMEEGQNVTNGYTMPASNTRIKFKRYINPISWDVLDSAKFEITDEKGNKFYLSNKGENFTYSFCPGQRLSGYGVDRSLSFYLDKIKTVNGEEIRFFYKSSPAAYTYFKGRSETVARKPSLDFPCDHFNEYSYSSVCDQKFRSVEALLDSVWVSNGTGIKVNYGQRLDLVDHNGINPNSAITGLKIYEHQLLLKTVVFDQTYFTSGMGTTSDDRRLKLNKVSFLGSDSNPSDKMEYVFQYNGTALPNRLSLDQDSLGYYNHNAGNTTLIPRLSDRSRTLTGTKASVLEKIIYPTGGSTEFNYQLSRLSDWGLAVTDIIDRDGTAITNHKSYVYRNPKGGGNDYWSEIDKPVYFKFKAPNDWDDFDVCLINFEYGAPTQIQIDLKLNRAEPYFEEIDELLESSGSEGKTSYRYSWQSFFTGIAQLPVELIEKISYAKVSGAYVPVRKEQHEYFAKVETLGIFEEPAGLKEKMAIGKQIWRTREEMVNLKNEIGNPIPKAGPAYYSQLVYELRSIPYYKTKTKVWEYNADGTSLFTETDYNFDNDWHGLPTRVLITGSDGQLTTTTTAYPQDYANGTGFIDEMVSGNLLAYPIETVNYKTLSGSTNIVSGHIKTYKIGGNGLVDRELELELNGALPSSSFKFSNGISGAIPPFLSYNSYNPDLRYSTRITADRYDPIGNLLQYSTAGGQTTAYLWSYMGQYPIAEFRNAKYVDIETILGTANIASFRNNIPDKAAIDNYLAPAISGLPTAQVTSFSYRPLSGLVSKKEPNGLTTYYEYDSFQRLLNVKDHDNNIVRNYKYKLASAPNWTDTGIKTCEVVNGANTGIELMQQIDNNPVSATYNSYRTRSLGNTGNCSPSIFAKITKVNAGGSRTYSYAHIVVSFYSDIACTIPVSVTGLQVNYSRMEYDILNSTSNEVPLSVIVSGHSIELHNRVLVEERNVASNPIFQYDYLLNFSPSYIAL